VGEWSTNTFVRMLWISCSLR